MTDPRGHQHVIIVPSLPRPLDLAVQPQSEDDAGENPDEPDGGQDPGSVVILVGRCCYCLGVAAGTTTTNNINNTLSPVAGVKHSVLFFSRRMYCSWLAAK